MKKITGIMVYYYFVCKRKLWYFYHDLTMESNSELVGMGKLIDEETYRREKKSILVDETIHIDFLKNWKVIHEVKKSRKVEEASIWQLKYYMWTLEKKSLNIEKGILDYPMLRQRETINASDVKEDDMLNILMSIDLFLENKTPPQRIKKPYCKKCA